MSAPSDNTVRDFDRGSSRMKEADAFGHVADKLGEVADHLRAIAFRMGVGGKGVRATYAALLNNLTMLRDSLRSVALLRGNESWMPFVGEIERMRDNVSLVGMMRLRDWPTRDLLAVAEKVERVKAIVAKKRHAREKIGTGVVLKLRGRK